MTAIKFQFLGLMWYGPFSVFGPKERNNLLFHRLEQILKLTNYFSFLVQKTENDQYHIRPKNGIL